MSVVNKDATYLLYLETAIRMSFTSENQYQTIRRRIDFA